MLTQLAKTVLIITHVVPYPPAAGNETRILKLITWFRKRGYRVVLLLNTDPLDPAIRESLGKIVDGMHCRDEDIPDVETPKPANQGGIFKAVLKSAVERVIKTSVKEDVADKEYKKRAEAVKKGLCPDKLMQMTHYYCSKYKPFAVVAEYIFTAPCLDVVPPGTLKLIDTHDMFSRKKEQVLSFGVEDPLYCSPAEERAYLLRSDVIVAIQADEAEMFQGLVPERKVVTVGIDYDIVAEIDNSRVIPGRVLVVGSDNPLNVHGLHEFHRNAWPLVREAHPDAVLRIIGKLGSKFQTDDKSVEIAGWVESLDDEYRKACVVINPTVAGTGLKIKCVEALCRAKPLVATPNSVEGLSYKGDAPFIVCDNWTVFADAVNILLGSEEKRLELQKRALDFAGENFSQDKVYGPLSHFFPVSDVPLPPSDEELFAGSSDTLIRIDALSSESLRPLHQVNVSTMERNGAAALILHSSGEDPWVGLPEIVRPADCNLLLRVDMICPADTILQVFYKTTDCPGYSEAMSISKSVKTGRNVMIIPLNQPDICGALRLDPGKIPGEFVIHAIELRAVPRHSD
jgi:glycosyltransferase involved in cell wall biosynthesis